MAFKNLNSWEVTCDMCNDTTAVVSSYAEVPPAPTMWKLEDGKYICPLCQDWKVKVIT